MLCERLSEGPDAVNIDLLQAQLDEHKVPVPRRDLTSDIAELRESELIDLDNSYRGGTYRLAVPLMARWVQVNVDFKEAVVARSAGPKSPERRMVCGGRGQTVRENSTFPHLPC